jgi:uncharacterized protein YfeS
VARYEFTDGKSNKFWEASLEGSQIQVSWGAIGTAGRAQVKDFADATVASAALQKLFEEKVGKGYVLVGQSAPRATRFFDDENEGLSRSTSHPNFVAVAPEDFYYDCADDFSPFGNDDGSDTLASLTEWYREGGHDAKIMRFLKGLLADWDFGLPRNIIRADHAVVETWLLGNEMNDTYLQSECRARVATAFGQLKIVGTVIPELLDEADASLTRLLWLNARAVTVYPAWAHGSADHTSLVTMQSALRKVARSS